MKYRIYLCLFCIESMALVILGITGVASWIIVSAGIISIITAWAFYKSVVMPLRAVENGMNLLKEQDFSSRLRPPGQPEADKVVELFNGLMGTMKMERLRLLEQNNFLTQVMEVSPAGVAITDYNGVITECNAAFRALDSETLRNEMATLKRGEKRMVRPEGTLILRLRRLSFMDSGHRRDFYMVEPMTEEIVRAEKDVITRIVRTIGHEVNNSLGAVVSVLDTVGSLAGNSRDVTEAVDASIASCQNLVRFVSTYSELVKLPEPEIRPTDIGCFLESVLPALGTLLPPDARLELKAESGITAGIDTMLMERVLVNIVKNAAESVERHDVPGRIVISLTKECLEISDNGPGIAPEDAGRIFTPFFSTKHPDRGLGLMLVAEILNRHGFSFTLTSDAAAGTTSFRIHFR